MEGFISLINQFFLCFIPIFIAIDAIGVMPLLVGMMDHVEESHRRETISYSVMTAGVVGIGFLFLGKLIFWIIGVTVNDFRIAGGLILLILAILDLVSEEKTRRRPARNMGVFPIGTPLIAGPAVLAALLAMADNYSIWVTLLAFLSNLVLVYILFLSAGKVVKILGSGGTKAAGKIASLLLAAYGIMLIRSGLEAMLRSMQG